MNLNERIERLSTDQRQRVADELARLKSAARPAPDHDSSTAQLVAYFVPENGAGPSTRNLQRTLRQRLPEHMVPGRFISLESIPRLPNGKVNRRQLPVPSPRTESESGSVVAPRTDTEALLASAWSEALGVRTVSVHDRYFDLGGDSLISMRLLARLSEHVERLTPRHFMANPTIAELAETIDRSPDQQGENTAITPNETSGQEALALQRSGTNPPLFLVPPEGARVSAYRELADRMAPDQPCYCLRIVDPDRHAPPELDELVDPFLEQIRSVSPAGPYYLLGYCEGALIAWEIACRLRDEGETVAFLGNVNTPNPAVIRVKSFVRRAEDRLRRMDSVPVQQKVARLSVRLLRWCARTLRRILARNPSPLRDRSQPAWRFRPRTFDGRLTLFTSEETRTTEDAVFDDLYGWKPLALQGIDLRTVRGRHFEILKSQNVDVLTECLRSSLQDAFVRNERRDGGPRD